MDRARSIERPTVLVVDDEPAVREALRLTLEDDYEVIEAGDGAEATAIVGAHSVDLVLLDVLLPGIDGLEVLQQLKAVRQEMPIVMVSAVRVLRTAVDAMRLGACDYLTKPFRGDDLLGSVRRALGERHGRSNGDGKGRPAGRRLIVLGDPGLGAVLAVTLRQHCHVETWPGERAAPAAIVEARPAAVVTAAPRQAAELRLALRGPLPHCPVLLRSWERRPAGPGAVPPATLLPFFREVVTALRFSPEVNGRMLEMPAAVLSVLEYVSAHYGGRIRLPIIAAVSSTSPRYLVRTFQRCMALTVKQFVTRVRVEVALYLLARTDEKLDALAERVGFADASHLSRVLLRYTGRRPGEYRLPPA